MTEYSPIPLDVVLEGAEIYQKENGIPETSVDGQQKTLEKILYNKIAQFPTETLRNQFDITISTSNGQDKPQILLGPRAIKLLQELDHKRLVAQTISQSTFLPVDGIGSERVIYLKQGVIFALNPEELPLTLSDDE